MKNLQSILGVLFIASLFFACSKSGGLSASELESIRQEVMNNDLEFSKYSEENGFAKALAQYAADDAIKLNPQQYSSFGKASLQADADSDTLGNRLGTLTWTPRKVHVSSHGDMAAAFGDWFFKTKSRTTSNDTTFYGNYLTVWKKQSDGQWKFILDGGNPVPGPTTEQMLEAVK